MQRRIQRGLHWVEGKSSPEKARSTCRSAPSIWALAVCSDRSFSWSCCTSSVNLQTESTSVSLVSYCTSEIDDLINLPKNVLAAPVALALEEVVDLALRQEPQLHRLVEARLGISSRGAELEQLLL